MSEKQPPQYTTPPPVAAPLHGNLYPNMPIYPAAPQPPQHHFPQTPSEPREWSTGLCGCSFGGCCYSWWCPCIVHSEITQHLQHLQDYGQPIDERAVSSCDGLSIAYCLVNYFTGCACVFDMIRRGDIRKRYNIKGNGCGDCCTSCFCVPCNQQQQMREVRAEEDQLRAQFIQSQPLGTQQMKPTK